jgi:hypothetical protein
MRPAINRLLCFFSNYECYRCLYLIKQIAGERQSRDDKGNDNGASYQQSGVASIDLRALLKPGSTRMMAEFAIVRPPSATPSSPNAATTITSTTTPGGISSVISESKSKKVTATPAKKKKKNELFADRTIEQFDDAATKIKLEIVLEKPLVPKKVFIFAITNTGIILLCNLLLLLCEQAPLTVTDVLGQSSLIPQTTTTDAVDRRVHIEFREQVKAVAIAVLAKATSVVPVTASSSTNGSTANDLLTRLKQSGQYYGVMQQMKPLIVTYIKSRFHRSIGGIDTTSITDERLTLLETELAAEVDTALTELDSSFDSTSIATRDLPTTTSVPSNKLTLTSSSSSDRLVQLGDMAQYAELNGDYNLANTHHLNRLSLAIDCMRQLPPLIWALLTQPSSVPMGDVANLSREAIRHGKATRGYVVDAWFDYATFQLRCGHKDKAAECTRQALSLLSTHVPSYVASCCANSSVFSLCACVRMLIASYLTAMVAYYYAHVYYWKRTKWKKQSHTL